MRLPAPWRNRRPLAPALADAARRNLRGIVLMLLATACIAGMHGLVRQMTAGLHPFEVAFFRNAVVPIFLLPWLLRAGWHTLRPRRLDLHVWRALIGICALLAWFYALSLLPLAEATALNFTSTMFATIGAALVLRERVRLPLWVAVATGFAGVLVMLQPGRDAASFGGLLVMLASLFWAASLLLAKAVTRHDSTLGIVALMATFSALFSLLPALFVWQTPTLAQVPGLLAIGALGTLGYLFFTQALREADAAVVFPLDFLRLLWAVLFGYLLFGEYPDLAGWVGATLITASAAYIAFREAPRRPPASSGRDPAGPGQRR